MDSLRSTVGPQRAHRSPGKPNNYSDVDVTWRPPGFTRPSSTVRRRSTRSVEQTAQRAIHAGAGAGRQLVFVYSALPSSAQVRTTRMSGSDRARRSTVVSYAAGIGGLALMVAGIAIPYAVIPPGDDWCSFCSAPSGPPPATSTSPRPTPSATTVLAATRAIPNTPTATTTTAPPIDTDRDDSRSDSAGLNGKTSAHPRPKGQDGDEQQRRQRPHDRMTADRAQHEHKSPHGPHGPKF
jgi:hypothetical protein